MNDSNFLGGRTALITGAGRGIGREIALVFADAGADVAIVEHPEQDTAADVADAIRQRGRKGESYLQDLARTQDLTGLVDRVAEDFGAIDIVVNNAAISFLEHFNQISVERWRTLMAVNVDAPFFIAQRAAEHMIAGNRPGRIINMSSKNGLVAEAGLTHYNTSKGAIELLTQSLAVELGGHGITVNAIAPGVIDTQMASDFPLDWERFRPYHREHVPLGRYGTVADCAAVALFLASPAAGYITGQHIVVDGGVLANQIPRLQFMPPYHTTLSKTGAGE
jgi:NAD(P)-dependent dehydrogenase (short-subunit alcohol dehydrogenase family)